MPIYLNLDLGLQLFWIKFAAAVFSLQLVQDDRSQSSVLECCSEFSLQRADRYRNTLGMLIFTMKTVL